MAMIRGVVFDLDDTLYLETEYVRSGFWHIAAHLGNLGRFGRDQLFNCLWEWFQAGVRGDIFNRLLALDPILAQQMTVEKLVTEYRSHAPSIRLQPHVVALLQMLRARGYRVGVLSDGPLASQQAKVVALGLDAQCDLVVLTDQWGQPFWKPHPRGYKHFQRQWGLPPNELLYVGDNPLKDFVTPRGMGWFTVRLHTPGQLSYGVAPPSPLHAAAVEISNLEELRGVLGI